MKREEKKRLTQRRKGAELLFVSIVRNFFNYAFEEER